MVGQFSECNLIAWRAKFIFQTLQSFHELGFDTFAEDLSETQPH